jgi:pimeloyl-ACP methyl ester carboxylesterase
MPNLTVNGVNIWYQRAGKGPAVILLHAFVVTSAMWHPQVAALTDAGYDVICVDQRGHGQSSTLPGPTTILQMADDIHKLIAQLKLERASVVGLSMGGRVAMLLALDNPQDVAALVLVSAKSEPAREIKAELEALSQRAAQGELTSVIEEWYDERYQRLAVYAPDLYRELKAGWHHKSGNGFIGAARAIIEMESMTTRVSEIRAPTLAMAGALDSPCHPYVAWYERSIPNCQGVIVPEAAHFVNIEQPERFNELLLMFLADKAGWYPENIGPENDALLSRRKNQ